MPSNDDALKERKGREGVYFDYDEKRNRIFERSFSKILQEATTICFIAGDIFLLLEKSNIIVSQSAVIFDSHGEAGWLFRAGNRQDCIEMAD